MNVYINRQIKETIITLKYRTENKRKKTPLWFRTDRNKNNSNKNKTK